MNDSIKKKVPANAEPINGIGQVFTRTTQSTGTETITQEVSLQTKYALKTTVSGSLTFKKIVEVGGEASKEEKWSVTTAISNANTETASSKFKIQFKIDDDSPDDIFRTITWGDPVFGTPVFKIDGEGSSTSCPYEGGFQLDQPIITVMDPVTLEPVKSAKYSDLEDGQEVIFTLNLKNGNTRDT